MKRNKMNHHALNTSENRPLEISPQDISLIRARESSRTRRSNIEWL